MKTIAWEKVGEVIVFVSLKANPPNEEWDQYVAFLRRELRPGIPPKLLVWSEGGGPSAAQRQRMNDVVKTNIDGARVSVVTSSSVVRGIVTALSWVFSVYQAFTPEEISRAIVHLDADVSETSILTAIGKLRAEIENA